MKQAKISEEALKIYENMEDRMLELSNKLIRGNYNMATQFAYKIGFISDIDNCLKKLKIKRTMVNFDNVEEVEMGDIFD